MTKTIEEARDEDDIKVSVRYCNKCPQIHLVVDDSIEMLTFSVGLSEAQWDKLFTDYQHIKAAGRVCQ